MTDHSKPENDEEAALFAAVTKEDLPWALKHLRNWMSYIDDHHRQRYANLIENQAKLIAWLVEQRRATPAQLKSSDDAGSSVEDKRLSPAASCFQQGAATTNRDGTASATARGELSDVGNVAKPQERPGRPLPVPPASSEAFPPQESPSPAEPLIQKWRRAAEAIERNSRDYEDDDEIANAEVEIDTLKGCANELFAALFSFSGRKSMNTIARCSLCGEPMPAGEEMFKYHGYSGPCPKPPLPKSPSDPAVIIAGIKQFGLATDGSDLRDLSAAFERLAAQVERMRAALESLLIYQIEGDEDYVCLSVGKGPPVLRVRSNTVEAGVFLAIEAARTAALSSDES